jgi:hypothetical protein
MADPHPPDLPAGSSLSRGAGEGLYGCISGSSFPAMRERVPTPDHSPGEAGDGVGISISRWFKTPE